jgi:hypothetical protein
MESFVKIGKRLFVLAFLYVTLPLLVYVLRYKVVVPVYLFADDAFYYLDIARNSIGRYGFTFDGQYITNGFHPLWQYLLVGLGKLHIVDYSNRTGTLLRVFYANTLILGLGAAVFCAACARYLRQPLLALLTVAPGLFWMLGAPITAIYFATWYYANGMESALALLCFSVALLLYHQDDQNNLRLAFVAFWLGLAVLARLDDIFIAASIAIWILLKTPAQERFRKLLALSPIAWMILAYVLYNRVTVGVFLPLSGAAKAGFAFEQNFKWTIRFFLPILTGDLPRVLRQGDSGRLFVESTERQIQMVFPAVICAIELLYVRRRRLSGVAFTLLHAAAIGVILKAAYNFFFVQNLDQGLWYYTVSIAIANFILVLWLSRAVTRLWPTALETRQASLRFIGLHLLWVLFTLNIFINARNEVGSVGHINALNNIPLIQGKLKSLGADKVIEIDDGFVGYVDGVSSVGGLGLVLDREAATALKQGNFLDVMYRRGYRVIVGEAGYATMTSDVAKARAAGADAGLLKILPSEFHRYNLIPVGQDGAEDQLSYFRLEPVASASPSP